MTRPSTRHRLGHDGAPLGHWVGDFGNYAIPEKFRGIMIRDDGGLDRRNPRKLFDAFRAWVLEMDAAATAEK